MKKIIIFLAEISGVSDDIRSECLKEAGQNMQQYAHWFTGGLMVDGHKYDISNILYEYPKKCLNNGRSHLFGSQFTQLRQYLWDLSNDKKSIIVELNKSNDGK